jgi:hypothetical protein
VLKAIVGVLADQSEPMRPKDTHAAVEAALGEPAAGITAKIEPPEDWAKPEEKSAGEAQVETNPPQVHIPASDGSVPEADAV